MAAFSVLLTGGIKRILLSSPFLRLPSNLSFLNLHTNAYKLNISVISASGWKFSPQRECVRLSWLSKLLPAVKAKQPCYCCIPRRKHLWSRTRRVAVLTQLLCSLCLILMSALDISLVLLIHNRLGWGRRTPKQTRPCRWINGPGFSVPWKGQ